MRVGFRVGVGVPVVMMSAGTSVAIADERVSEKDKFVRLLCAFVAGEGFKPNFEVRGKGEYVVGLADFPHIARGGRVGVVVGVCGNE